MTQMSPEQAAHAQTTSEPVSRMMTGRQLLLVSLLLAVISGIMLMVATGLVWTINGEGFTGELLQALLLVGGWVASFISLALLIAGSVRWGVYGHQGSPRTLDELDLRNQLTKINESLRISETARQIVYRDDDLKLLRDTIQKDVQTRDFDGALVLVDQLSQTFGYREEAEEVREKIHKARIADMEARVTQAIAKLDEVIARNDFEQAYQLAGRIGRSFPDVTRVKGLSRHVLEAREQYKKNLEREFLQAATRDDVERAMELLKELDKYLSEKEAAPFRETAKGVIGKKRDNLGVQFKLAVQDHDWVAAVQSGEQIIADFPNSRMAEEVRGMIDLLRERAAGQKAASGVAMTPPPSATSPPPAEPSQAN